MLLLNNRDINALSALAVQGTALLCLFGNIPTLKKIPEAPLMPLVKIKPEFTDNQFAICLLIYQHFCGLTIKKVPKKCGTSLLKMKR